MFHRRSLLDEFNPLIHEYNRFLMGPQLRYRPDLVGAYEWVGQKLKYLGMQHWGAIQFQARRDPNILQGVREAINNLNQGRVTIDQGWRNVEDAIKALETRVAPPQAAAARDPDRVLYSGRVYNDDFTQNGPSLPTRSAMFPDADFHSDRFSYSVDPTSVRRVDEATLRGNRERVPRQEPLPGPILGNSAFAPQNHHTSRRWPWN